MNVNGLAPALNTIPFTSVSAAKNTFLMLENANVAVSAAPLGTVAGVQFAAVFHVPEPGFAFQVALPAKAAVAAKNMSTPTPWSALPWTVLEKLAEGRLEGWFSSRGLLGISGSWPVNPMRFPMCATYGKG